MSAKQRGQANVIEMSHDRARQVLRLDAVTPIDTSATPTMHVVGPLASDRKNHGRPFAKDNKAWRIRDLKRRSEGIATMDPKKAPTWLRPFIELGRPYVTALLALLDGKPVLHPLAGDVADSHVLYRATLALATAAETPKERNALMAEARAWLREHRTAIATLQALAGGLQLPHPADDIDPFAKGDA